MARVITFSRYFPGYHPRKGEPTYFVEKIWKGMYDNELSSYLPFGDYVQQYDEAFPVSDSYDPLFNIHAHQPKYHTIRSGNRWKVGDKFSPRVWSGKPYNSKQIIIAPDIEVKKIWNFKMDLCGVISIDGFYTEEGVDETIAKNDGLSDYDFFKWFMPNFNKPQEFKGQIICWNENIEY